MFSEERSLEKSNIGKIKNRHSRKVHRRVDRTRLLGEVAELYLKGKTLQEIGNLYGVSVTAASVWLKEVRENWLASMVRNYAEAQAIQLMKIDKVEQEYWEAWEKSKRGLKKTNKGKLVRTGRAGGDEVSDFEEVLHQPGEPKYLEGIQRCIAQRVKILGLDAPIKIMGSVEISENSMLNRDNLTMEEKMKMFKDFLVSMEQTVLGDNDGRIREGDSIGETENLLIDSPNEHSATDTSISLT